MRKRCLVCKHKVTIERDEKTGDYFYQCSKVKSHRFKILKEEQEKIEKQNIAWEKKKRELRKIEEREKLRDLEKKTPSEFYGKENWKEIQERRITKVNREYWIKIYPDLKGLSNEELMKKIIERESKREE